MFTLTRLAATRLILKGKRRLLLSLFHFRTTVVDDDLFGVLQVTPLTPWTNIDKIEFEQALLGTNEIDDDDCEAW